MEKNIYNNYCKFSNYKTKEDFIFWLKLLKKKYKIFGIDQNLAVWRKTKNSLSSSTKQKLKDGFNVYFKFMQFSFLKSLSYLIILSLNFIKKQYLK